MQDAFYADYRMSSDGLVIGCLPFMRAQGIRNEYLEATTDFGYRGAVRAARRSVSMSCGAMHELDGNEGEIVLPPPTRNRS